MQWSLPNYVNAHSRTYYKAYELVVLCVYFEVVSQVWLMQEYSVAVLVGANNLTAIFMILQVLWKLVFAAKCLKASLKCVCVRNLLLIVANNQSTITIILIFMPLLVASNYRMLIQPISSLICNNKQLCVTCAHTDCECWIPCVLIWPNLKYSRICIYKHT